MERATQNTRTSSTIHIHAFCLTLLLSLLLCKLQNTELLYFLFEHSILIVRKALYRLFMFNYLFRHRRSGFYADSKRYKSEQKKIEQRYTISLFGQLTFWDVNVNNVVSLVTSYQKAYWAFNGVKIWCEEKL